MVPLYAAHLSDLGPDDCVFGFNRLKLAASLIPLRAAWSGCRERSDQMADGLQVLFAVDLAKTAHESKEQALTGRDLVRLIRLKALEKVIDRRAQCARDLKQAGCRYAAYSPLPLEDHLLRREANTLSQIMLAHPKHEPTLANPRADKLVDLR